MSLITNTGRQVMTKDLTCCPKCQSKSGFYTKETVIYERLWEWETKDSACESTGNTIFGKTVRCIDCNTNLTHAVGDPWEWRKQND